MTTRLTDALATTDALADVFSDASVIQALLDVEAALARAEGQLGVIPSSAAEIITRAAVAEGIDADALARGARESGTIVIPLVAALTARVAEHDAHAARFVHWGATSQDVSDTALVLLVDRACGIVARDHARLAAALGALSDRHAGDLMTGRTLLQPAPPITFGLKAAGWYAGAVRSWTRLDEARRDAAVLQFGGASGTLAALGTHGPAVAEALAREINLPAPPAPWHTSRDRLAALVAACGIYTGVLGKIARDVSLLMQAEVGEAAEPGGASSSMPHKRNPSGCAIALAAAARLPGLVATSLAGLVQEHERGVGAWHAEWPTMAAALQATGAAAAAIADVISGLSVRPDRMRANLEATRGVVLAERVALAASAVLGRDEAARLVREAVARAGREGATLEEALRATPALWNVLSDEDRRAAGDHASYLGAAEALRRRLLGSGGE